MVAYGQILKKNVLGLPRLGCVNIHSSLLPRWRGAAPIQHAILAGDVESGVSTMYMVERLDAGAILLQSKTPIGPRETASTLHDRLAQMGGDLIVETVAGLEAGTILARPQEEARVTYASKLTKDMERLNPGDTVSVADRMVRALNPWPGTSVRLETGERLRIREAVVRADFGHESGRIFERNGMLLLGFDGGALELIRVQYEGKKEIDAAAFMNGLRGKKQKLPISWAQ